MSAFALTPVNICLRVRSEMPQQRLGVLAWTPPDKRNAAAFRDADRQ
jgi:hypothetical protein